MALVNIDLDLQISICTLLHPSDILILRKTCKTLQLVTRQRIVWVDALRRVCLQNTLFLPSFPIIDMSDVELEQAAIAPRRWIELSTSFADSEVAPTTTRIIDNPSIGKQSSLILVPGGRYMVVFSPNGLGVWDLGYTPSVDCKLIASVGPEGGSYSGDVHTTADGMGLVIFLRRLKEHCSVYEIYPENENPQLTIIARLDLSPQYRHLPSYVSPDKIIWFDPHAQETIFRLWDYRLNTSVAFAANIDTYSGKAVATQTAIILLREEDICIWAIPPLLPQPPNFDDYDLIHPPVIRLKFPDDLIYSPITTWRTMSSWYFDSSKPLYFDKVYSPRSKLERFKIIIEPDFSNATLHLINTIQLPTRHFDRESPFQSMFCEDTLVYSWSSYDGCGIYSGSTLSGPTLLENPSMTQVSLAVESSCRVNICPASGRSVYLCDPNKIVVFDFLPHRRL